jgi:hypothetical protein
MKVRELIEKLKEFDPELEVIITDGYECRTYHTKGIEIQVFEWDGKKDLDIGIGGCEID